MPNLLFANNATALLAASISDTDLTIQVANGYGTLYPNPGVDEYFYVTLVNSNGDREIVKITERSTDLLTVPTGGRGQDGTSAQSWTGGLTRVDARLTRVIMEEFIRRGGDSMSGDLDMDGNELQNADIQDSTMTGGQLVGVAMRGTVDDASNEVLVPNDGTRATAGGATILVTGDNVAALAIPNGMITMWYGVSGDLPAGWAICNGSNGTPDLRGLFVRGATVNGDIGGTGGAASATPSIGAAGAHDHGGSTGETTLDETNIPLHSHRLYVWEAGSNGPGQMENFGNSGIGPARGVAGNADSNTYAYRQETVGGNDLIEETGQVGGAAHAHSISAVTDHNHTLGAVATIPPYKMLYYVMKIPLVV
jgi:hypothetical protein